MEAAPNVDLNFRHAQATPTPLETPSPGPPPRTTSLAKTLDADYQPPGNSPASTYPVEQAQGEQQGEGSGMVEDDQPEPKPINRSEEAKAVDRTAFDQAWAAEQAKADEANRLAEAVAADLQASKSQPQPEQDRGMGMG